LRTQRQPNIQGFNAQAVVTEQQIIIAAEIVTLHAPRSFNRSRARAAYHATTQHRAGLGAAQAQP
jgi:hypothetical protein